MTSTASVQIPEHLSTLVLHQLRYGELEGPALSTARAHLAGCPRCAARLSFQERERAAFVLKPVPDAIREHSVPARAPWWRELAPLLGALAAAALLFVVVPTWRESSPQAPEGITFRGQGNPPQATVQNRVASRPPVIAGYVDEGMGPRPLRDTDVLGANDRVQLAYDPQGASSVAIAGRDGSGLVEVYTTNAPTGVGLVRMPFSLTLDGSPGVQELFVVGSDRPLDELRVKAAITTGVPGTRVARIAIQKMGSPR